MPVPDGTAGGQQHMDALDRLQLEDELSQAVWRAESAEAEVRQLREERDAARVGHRVLTDGQNELIEQLEAAEAELARYREGLRRIADEPPDRGLTPNFREFARALLADSPTSSPTVMSPVRSAGANLEGGEA